MTESIVYDVCDEFSVDGEESGGWYALSNSCGQNFRTYQEEVCMSPVSGQGGMSCTVDRRMEIISAGHTSSASVGRAPPPFSCRPKIDSTDYTGYWDVKTCL